MPICLSYDRINDLWDILDEYGTSAPLSEVTIRDLKAGLKDLLACRRRINVLDKRIVELLDTKK